MSLLAPLLAACAVWYLGTGAVVLANRRSPSSHGFILIACLLLVGAAMAGIDWSRNVTTPAGAYVAFVSTVLLWGWLEMSYLMGVVTGPEKRPCPPGLPLWRRFVRGVNVSLYHELTVVAVGIVLVVVSTDAANGVAGWTFVTLWLMRWSAKLNLFLGVPNMDLELLPEHMRYLGSYMSKRRMNPLFPVSVSVGAVICGMHALTALEQDAGAFEQTAGALLATITALAVLEHWLLVLPVRDSRLWRWAVQ